MSLEPNTLRHLAFIKYLYRLGMRQSETPPPLSSASLLNFHDAVESFLQLACERLNVRTNNNTKFMEYFDLLKVALGAELSQAESMKRLNKARVELKHHGLFPFPSDIEGFRRIVTNFFQESTLLIFKIPFDAISMSEYVKPENASQTLKDAESLLTDGKLIESLGKIALAFRQMLDDYELRKRDDSFRSPFFFGKEYPGYVDSSSIGLGHTSSTEKSMEQRQFERKLGEFVDKVNDSLKGMQDAIKIIAMGIDYRRYSMFRILTPTIDMNMQGKYLINNRSYEKELTPADVIFCIEFVVETAVKLQEFDYTLQPAPPFLN